MVVVVVVVLVLIVFWVGGKMAVSKDDYHECDEKKASHESELQGHR